MRGRTATLRLRDPTTRHNLPIDRADLMMLDGFKHLETDSAGNPRVWGNHYYCPQCGTDWTEPWSCQCDDDCPNCGQNQSPTSSEWLGPDPETPAYELWEKLPEAE